MLLMPSKASVICRHLMGRHIHTPEPLSTVSLAAAAAAAAGLTLLTGLAAALTPTWTG
jgi:hypothetical protein